MPKAYAYVRMSTPSQVRGNSLDRQRELHKAFATEHGLTLDDEFTLDDIGRSAYSGENLEKGKLGIFLQAMRDGKIEKGSYLLLESLDRLSRQPPIKHLTLFLEILNHGINIAIIKDSAVATIFNSESGPNDLMLGIGSMQRGHEESSLKSYRLSNAWNDKRKLPGILTKRCVGWVEPNSNSTAFVLINDRANIVRRIFDEAANHGMGADVIARRLNRDGINTFGKSTGWHKSYVQKLLANRAALGEFQPHKMVGGRKGKREPVGEPINDYYPRVIEDELFYKAQVSRNAHKIIDGDAVLTGGGRKGTHYSNLFTGLLRCTNCFGPVTFVNKGPSNGSFLFCENARRGIGSCVTTGWRYEDFESTFLRFVEEAKLGEIIGDIQPSSDKKQLIDNIKSLEGQLAVLGDKREKAYQLFIGPESSDFVKRRFHELDEQVIRSEETIKQSKERLMQINFKETAFTQSKEDLDKLVRRLQTLDSKDAFTVRAAVANHFHDTIDVIGVQIAEPRMIHIKFKDGAYRTVEFGQVREPEFVRQTNRLFDSDEDFNKGTSPDRDTSWFTRVNKALRRVIQTPED
jgi:DNA invertase Pin-like site-specific DNA recombinase